MGVKRLTVYGPLIFWCFLIWRFSSTPDLDLQHLTPGLPNAAWWDYPLRKLAHVLEYVILYLLAARAWPPKRAWLFCVLYAISDEIHQTYVPGRAGRASDVVIDGMAAALAAVAPLLRRR